MRFAFRAIVIGVALAVVAASSGGASAQSYPTRPITIVVPYPAGGPTDTLARIMSDRLKAALGQTIIIENITGAGGSIGVGHVAHAAPDGYTLALGHNQTHVINPVTLKLNYDVVKDFEPVTLIADTPIWIVASKTLPADDMNGFISWLKENGDKANAGTVGVGGPNDLAALDFEKKTGTHFQLTPYRGGAPLLQDLLAGHIDFTFGQASTYLPYVRNGQLKAYGVLMPKRWWAAPEVPTLDELGIKGTYATFWHGIWAPKDTPKPIIAKLDSAFMETLADPAVKQRFKDVGQEMWPVAQQNPAGLAAQQKAEIERWWPIVKAAGIKPQ